MKTDDDFEIRLSKAVLRYPREQDAKAIVRHANNPKIARYLRDRFPSPYTETDGRWLVEEANAEPQNCVLVIEVDGEAAGAVGFHGQDPNDVHRFSGEIGYWLGEEHWGKGIMTEAVQALTDYGFKSLGIRRVCACVYAPNSASAKVLEKSGYEFEGKMRSAVFKNGELLDALLYAKISDACH